MTIYPALPGQNWGVICRELNLRPHYFRVDRGPRVRNASQTSPAFWPGRRFTFDGRERGTNACSRGSHPTTLVIRISVCSRKSPRLGGWSRHPEVDRLQKWLIDRDEGGDQEDERLIAGIAEGMDEPGLLNDPLPGPQHHLGPSGNHVSCGRCPKSASPRFAFLV